MSESCHRGYKCFCFQCGEVDCERYEPETPEWIKKFTEDDELMQRLEKLRGEQKGNAYRCS